MDWRIEDIDQSSVDSFPGKEKSLVNSESYINLLEFQNSETYFGEIKESKGFTSAFENLKVDTGIDQQIDRTSFLAKDIATSSTEYKFKKKSPLCGFPTYEKSSLQLIIHGPEILNHQGTMHSTDDVAPYWKKDSRMWLWKSVRHARRKSKKCSVIRSSPNNRKDDFKIKSS